MTWSHNLWTKVCAPGTQKCHMPWHIECHMPLALLNVLTVANSMSRVHKLQICFHGVSEATSLIRCCSPPRMSFLLGKSASHHCSPWEHTGSFATDLNVPQWWIGQSPPLYILTQSVLVVQVLEVNMDRVTTLYCLLSKVRQSGTWEVSYVSVLFLSEGEWLSCDFGSQALGGCPMPANGNAAG